MVETLRDELGDGYDIMLDCWQAMDVNYVVKLAAAIENCAPRWLEEVAMPDRIDSYRKIREKTNIPISGAEHEYTRWGFKRFIDAEALDILQPDIYWAGGISETLKNHGAGHRRGPHHDPTRPFVPRWHPRIRDSVAASHTVPRILNQVEHRPPAFFGGPGQPRRRDD